MIMGDKCTRHCTFCDVAHGKPDPLDTAEPLNIANAIKAIKLRYVVITSVNRDDLRDGGASHFANCIQEIRKQSSSICIEILVPDFRGRMTKAITNLSSALPDILNHNIETVPRLYNSICPGSDYTWSLNIIKTFKSNFSHIQIKSGIMLGLGETPREVYSILKDLQKHGCNMITIGQYLQPSQFHYPVARYVTPKEFNKFGNFAKKIGFTQVACGPLVRSSYHAELQASGKFVH